MAEETKVKGFRADAETLANLEKLTKAKGQDISTVIRNLINNAARRLKA